VTPRGEEGGEEIPPRKKKGRESSSYQCNLSSAVKKRKEKESLVNAVVPVEGGKERVRSLVLEKK